MFTKKQEEILNRFADLSDLFFNLGITTTDSFTGEIGEYVACRHFNLKKTARVTRAVDGICENGNHYQVKAKVVSKNKMRLRIEDIDTTSFHYLVVVFFNHEYSPIKIVRVHSNKIKNGSIIITPTLSGEGIEVFDKSEINIPVKEKKAIAEFASAYNELENNGIIRSRRIVGDIGEFYASRLLKLELSKNKIEKGIDASHESGLTFEIKTRRVYESGRRLSESRRLNNLVGKTADYLIVVVLDRVFRCAGMWLIPMKQIVNPQSVHLNIVNNTPETLNVWPGTISWLKTGNSFTAFPLKKTFGIHQE